MKTATHHIRLQDMPLWRLIVLLDDAERWGDLPQIRVLSRIIQERLQAKRDMRYPARGDARHEN